MSAIALLSPSPAPETASVARLPDPLDRWDDAPAEEGLQLDAAPLRLARQIYATWLQHALQLGTYGNAGTMPALPRVAIDHQLDRALDVAGADAVGLLALRDTQRQRLAELGAAAQTLAMAHGADPAAAPVWDRLIELGLQTLQGFADLEIVFAAQRAAHDALTGLPGRAALQQRLQAEQSRVLRQGRQCAVALLDLDHFKRINDRHGHHTGDRVLAVFAATLRAGLRPYDGVYRYGGEEFVLVLPDATAAQAARILDRLRQRVAAVPVQIPDGALHIQFSAGVAALGERAIAQTLRCADAALYDAKARGRDQVRLGPCVAA